MDDYRDLFRRILIKLLIFLPFILWGFFYFKTSMKENAAVAIISFIILFAFARLALQFIAGDIANVLARPFGNLFFSSDSFDKPVPAYSRAEARLAEGEFESAIKEYINIIEEHDEAVRAFDGLLEICLVYLNRPDLATKYLNNGLELLEKEESKAHIKNTYDMFNSKKAVVYSGAIETRIEVDPSIVKDRSEAKKYYRNR